MEYREKPNHRIVYASKLEAGREDQPRRFIVRKSWGVDKVQEYII